MTTQVAIAEPLRELLTGLIDYAGLFPPASLPLDEALANFRRYRAGDHRWMLGRFIIPATKLDALSALLHEAPADDPLPLSVLGRGGSDVSAFEQGLEDDLAALATFRERHGAAVQVDFFETRLPALTTPAALVARATDLLQEASLFPFFEATPDADWETSIAAVVEAVAAQPGAGFKLRCGGVTADAFPSPNRVAFALVACRDVDVPLKATAGLHHPLRRYDNTVQAPMHGFINLFAAGILGQLHMLELPTIQAILEEEQANHFSFTTDALTWQGRSASADQIRALRQRALLSYGSCSFDEPREDLETLNLL
jgi:hypothetical protein